MTRFFRAPTLVLIAVAGLSACGTSPTPRLESAHAAYKKAESDPKITDNAPIDLHEAKKALAQGDKAESAADMDHYAEQAEKHLKIAAVNAERKLAEGETKKLSDEKIKVVLESREKEALRAKMDAEAKAQEAVKAKQDADAARAQAEQALAQIKALEAQLAELQAKQTDRGLVLTLGDVLFETGKAELLGNAMRNIDKIAEFLNKNPGRNVLVEGHTDNVGGDSYNLDLSQRRAESVRLALIQRGVAAERIQSRGYGEALPVASNDNSSGRQQNRRVEIVIGNEGQAVAPR
jgi:outer membrane protein OmpA-like peptidoglycan-associated protein